MIYVYAVAGSALMAFVAGIVAYPDGPEGGFWTEWAGFTLVFSLVACVTLAVSS